MPSLSTKAGWTFTALVAVLALVVLRQWDHSHGTIYNVYNLMEPFLMPSLENIVDLPLGEQVAHLRSIGPKRPMAERAVRYLFGEDFADASFGPRATRVKEFTIPSMSDPDVSIPVICACPHDAQQTDDDANGFGLPLVLYFHSGGIVYGSAKAELGFSRYVAAETGAVTCSIGYRLAPEHPYPAAVNDVLSASLSLIGGGDTGVSPAAKAFDVAIDASRVATFGSSAGGYMAANAARLLANSGVSVRFQVSIVPMVKPNCGTKSCLTYWRAKFWSGPNNLYAWNAYLPGDDGTLAADWRVSLLIDPPQETVARLPLAYVQLHTRDALRDEGEMYAERLQAQGKLAELKEYDTTHVAFIPMLAWGGPAEGAAQHAIKMLAQKLAA